MTRNFTPLYSRLYQGSNSNHHITLISSWLRPIILGTEPLLVFGGTIPRESFFSRSFGYGFGRFIYRRRQDSKFRGLRWDDVTELSHTSNLTFYPFKLIDSTTNAPPTLCTTNGPTARTWWGPRSIKIVCCLLKRFNYQNLTFLANQQSHYGPPFLNYVINQ